MLTRNNLHLTKKAVASVLKQDISSGVDLLVIDNGSTDGTREWLRSQTNISSLCPSPPMSVSAAWNLGLTVFLKKSEYVLVVNNDIELRPDTYAWLVGDGGGFVTAVGTNDPEKVQPPYLDPDPSKKRPHPDFSCFLIRKEVFEEVGPFDERFEGAYCEDSDYHVRMHRAAIAAYALELPFLHHGAQTVKNADPGDQKRIQIQADKNRALFKQIYGFGVGSPEYYASFGTGAPPA
jgi:GT2 family glycosyltransferase